MYSGQWLVLESRTGELADRKIAGDWHAGSTKERAQNQIMGAAEGGSECSLLAFLGWAEGCLLPTVSQS